MTNYSHSPGDHPEIAIPSSGIIVPQEICGAARHSRHDLPTIQFSYGGQSGINLLVAMRETHASLADYNTHPMTTTDEAASHINIRILWPGYAEYSSSTVIKESTRYGTVIPFAKWRLAMSIAKVIQEFYTRAVPVVQRESHREFASSWDIRRIPFDCLRLLELRPVSAGIWQPVIIYDRGNDNPRVAPPLLRTNSDYHSLPPFSEYTTPTVYHNYQQY